MCWPRTAPEIIDVGMTSLSARRPLSQHTLILCIAKDKKVWGGSLGVGPQQFSIRKHQEKANHPNESTESLFSCCLKFRLLMFVAYRVTFKKLIQLQWRSCL